MHFCLWQKLMFRSVQPSRAALIRAAFDYSSLCHLHRIKRKSHDKCRGLSFYGAGDEARTRYLHLGKVALYRMSYTRRNNRNYNSFFENVNTFFPLFSIIFQGNKYRGSPLPRCVFFYYRESLVCLAKPSPSTWWASCKITNALGSMAMTRSFNSAICLG